MSVEVVESAVADAGEVQALKLPDSQHMNRAPRPVRRSHRWRSWWPADDGRVSAFVVTIALAILVLAGLSLDGGLALAAKVEANGRAEAAARAGAQAIDLAVYRTSNRLQLVPVQAVANAQSYLAAVGASGTVTVSGDTVTVTITASQPTQLLGLVGVSSLHVHGVGSAHPQQGVVSIDP